MDFNPNISLFSGALNPVPVKEVSIQTAFDTIRSTAFETAVKAIRAEQDKKKRGALKKKLQAVTWSATFSRRNTEPDSLLSYSHIICHDVDNLEADHLEELKYHLEHDILVYAFFVSPSGNGLKVLFQVGTDATQHLMAWQAIGDYLNALYNIEPDESCKDISRLCFLSHDPEIHIKPGAVVITESYIKNELASFLRGDMPTAAQPKTPVQDLAPASTPADREQEFLKLCHEITIKSYLPVEGSYNKYINTFAIQANRYGLDQNAVAWAVARYCGFSAPDKDDIAVIRSVYAKDKFAHQHGEWAADYKASSGTRVTTSKSDKPRPAVKKKSAPYKHEPVVNDDVKFWFSVEKRNSKGELVYDPNTGEVKTEYQLSYDNGIEFLQNNGFFKMWEGDGYRLIRVNEQTSQIDVVFDLRLEEFMLDYLKSQRTEEFNRVREIFRRNVSKYCAPRQFAGLNYYKPEMRKDTRDTAYVYFSNCYFEVTATGTHRQEYSRMEGFIWKKQVIDQEFIMSDWKGCDYHLFIIRAITGSAHNDEDLLDEKDRQKYDSVVTAIGYMLHKYKDPSVTKAVVAVDRKTRSSNDEVNGGSGKSIVGKSFGKMRNQLMIDGQNFKFDDQFAFQGVSPDTELINFNDVNGSFNFQRLFGMITEEFTYRGLYKQAVTLPFSESPKFYISTNHTLRGDGTSIQRRQHIIEFSDYFNAIHTPAKEFGRMLFTDWDATEWSRFYSFFMHCITTYLQRGLVDFPIDNYELRKLLEWNKGAGAELNDYLNENVLEQQGYNNAWDKTELFAGFIKSCSVDTKYVTMNSFSKQVALWAKIKGKEINAHKNGDRDRRNGKDYLTFTDIPKENEPDIFDQLIAAQGIDLM